MTAGPSRTAATSDLLGGGFRDPLATPLTDAVRRIASGARQAVAALPVENLYSISDSYTFAQLDDMDPITLTETGVWAVWADLAVNVTSTADQHVNVGLGMDPAAMRPVSVPCWMPDGTTVTFTLNVTGIYVVDTTLDVAPVASIPADAYDGNATITAQLIRPLRN